MTEGTTVSKAVATSALVKKIVEVIREVGAVPKTGENQHFGYKYRRHEDITNKLQPALAKQGVVIVPVEKRIIANEPGYILLEVTYSLTDGDQAIEFKGIGEGMDKSKDGRPGDKAAYKAQTGAMKYALNDMLMLAGEDPEEDKTTHGEQNGKPPAGKQAPTAKPQTKPAAHVLTPEQEKTLRGIMAKMNYSARLVELGLQKAKIEGFEAAKTALEKKAATPPAPAAPKGGQQR